MANRIRKLIQTAVRSLRAGLPGVDMPQDKAGFWVRQEKLPVYLECNRHYAKINLSGFVGGVGVCGEGAALASGRNEV
jgi:hypothetical protein